MVSKSSLVAVCQLSGTKVGAKVQRNYSSVKKNAYFCRQRSGIFIICRQYNTPFMKKILLAFCAMLAACSLSMTCAAQARYGYLHYDALLQQMPETPRVMAQLDTLRAKYQAETDYNETSFNRQFAEFLQGQKDFPQNILLKRQRDLQDAMERGIAFRKEAEKLLRDAEEEMMAPVRERLDAAIRAVGLERGYEYIINLDQQAFPFLHPNVSEDATPFVVEKTSTVKQ